MDESFSSGAACVDGCFGNYTGEGWTYGGPAYTSFDQSYVMPPGAPATTPPTGSSTIQPSHPQGIPPVSAVPEPGTYALLAMGLALMAAVLKRNRRQA